MEFHRQPQWLPKNAFRNVGINRTCNGLSCSKMRRTLSIPRLAGELLEVRNLEIQASNLALMMKGRMRERKK